MMLRGAGSRSLTRIGEPHLGDAPTTSEWWGVFINVGIYSKTAVLGGGRGVSPIPFS